MLRPDTDDMIAFLDSLAKIDPVAMGKLIAHRVQCNETLRDHATVQTGPGETLGTGEVGMLGILNGYCGVIGAGKYKGWGNIAAIVEKDGRCTGFVATSTMEPNKCP